jgi:hypothetical protein
MSLHRRAIAAFDAALSTIRGDSALSAMYTAIAAEREHYQQKMSVALVGRVSSGKSTLTNALLGGQYAATGIEELTYNVTSLRHGPSGQLIVHFTDGRPPESKDRADLVELATRARASNEMRDYLAAIAYLEVTDPNPRLKPFDLVDTPGLDAVYGTEQTRKTLEFLGRSADVVREDTVSFAARADALVLVFPRAPAGTDAEIVEDFARSGLGTANPITAVGALTKIELHWPRYDPMSKGREDAARLMAVPGARRLLFELKPVAGKLAEAASVFTAQDYEDLTALSAVPAETLRRALKFGPSFKHDPHPELPVAAGRRAVLFDSFSGYGVFLSCELLRRKPPPSPEQLRTLLEERSGLADLRQLLFEHFARRSDVIKLRRAIDAVGAVPATYADGLSPRELDVGRRAAAEVTRLDQEPAFRELAMLRLYYQKELGFASEEGQELERMAGERGPSIAERLGRAVGTPLGDLAVIAADRHAYWSCAVIDPLYSGAAHGACQVMLNAYDRISNEIGNARRWAEDGDR